MLILSCRKQDKICIGQDIVLTIADLKGGKVRLGIEAPAELKIARTAGSDDDPASSRSREASRDED